MRRLRSMCQNFILKNSASDATAGGGTLGCFKLRGELFYRRGGRHLCHPRSTLRQRRRAPVGQAPFNLDHRALRNCVRGVDCETNQLPSRTGADKRRGTLQVLSRLVGEQPPITIICRGKGSERLARSESQACRPGVVVVAGEGFAERDREP